MKGTIAPKSRFPVTISYKPESEVEVNFFFEEEDAWGIYEARRFSPFHEIQAKGEIRFSEILQGFHTKTIEQIGFRLIKI